MAHLIQLASNFLLACLVFLPLERIIPFSPAQKIFRKKWTLDLTHVFGSGALVMLGSLILYVLSIAFLECFIPQSVRSAIAAQPVWLAFLEILIIADLGFYGVHRAFHAFPWLWKFHSIHHSIEEMDFLAAHRVHPVDQILTRGATLLPVFVLGFPHEAILLWLLLYRWQSLLIHSNVCLSFGPLRHIIASPVFHHWHHAHHPEAVDKNFAGQLSLLDFLFGTLHLPAGEVPEKYGIEARVPDTYLGQLAHPFKRKNP